MDFFQYMTVTTNYVFVDTPMLPMEYCTVLKQIKMIDQMYGTDVPQDLSMQQLFAKQSARIFWQLSMEQWYGPFQCKTFQPLMITWFNQILSIKSLFFSTATRIEVHGELTTVLNLV